MKPILTIEAKGVPGKTLRKMERLISDALVADPKFWKEMDRVIESYYAKLADEIIQKHNPRP